MECKPKQKNQIKFGDCSIIIKIGVIGGWLLLGIWIAAFAIGFINGMGGLI